MIPSSHTENAEGLGKQRIEALSDGIFAFAMTLLVLDVKIPKLSEALVNQGVLAQTLLDLWPKFLTFAMSFVTLGFFWVAHHGYSHFLKRTDRYFLWIKSAVPPHRGVYAVFDRSPGRLSATSNRGNGLRLQYDGAGAHTLLAMGVCHKRPPSRGRQSRTGTRAQGKAADSDGSTVEHLCGAPGVGQPRHQPRSLCPIPNHLYGAERNRPPLDSSSLTMPERRICVKCEHHWIISSSASSVSGERIRAAVQTERIGGSSAVKSRGGI